MPENELSRINQEAGLESLNAPSESKNSKDAVALLKMELERAGIDGAAINTFFQSSEGLSRSVPTEHLENYAAILSQFIFNISEVDVLAEDAFSRDITCGIEELKESGSVEVLEKIALLMSKTFQSIDGITFTSRDLRYLLRFLLFDTSNELLDNLEETEVNRFSVGAIESEIKLGAIIYHLGMRSFEGTIDEYGEVLLDFASKAKAIDEDCCPSLSFVLFSFVAGKISLVGGTKSIRAIGENLSIQSFKNYCNSLLDLTSKAVKSGISGADLHSFNIGFGQLCGVLGEISPETIESYGEPLIIITSKAIRAGVEVDGFLDRLINNTLTNLGEKLSPECIESYGEPILKIQCFESRLQGGELCFFHPIRTIIENFGDRLSPEIVTEIAKFIVKVDESEIKYKERTIDAFFSAMREMGVQISLDIMNDVVSLAAKALEAGVKDGELLWLLEAVISPTLVQLCEESDLDSFREICNRSSVLFSGIPIDYQPKGASDIEVGVFALVTNATWGNFFDLEEFKKTFHQYEGFKGDPLFKLDTKFTANFKGERGLKKGIGEDELRRVINALHGKDIERTQDVWKNICESLTEGDTAETLEYLSLSESVNERNIEHAIPLLVRSLKIELPKIPVNIRGREPNDINDLYNFISNASVISSHLLERLQPLADNSPLGSTLIDRIKEFRNFVDELEKRFSLKELKQGELRLEAKKEFLDCHYGDLGDCCITSNYGNEIEREDFQPIRIILDGKIAGYVYAVVSGKSIIIAGIEPNPLIKSSLEPNSFVRGVLGALGEWCKSHNLDLYVNAGTAEGEDDGRISQLSSLRSSLLKLYPETKELGESINFPAEFAVPITHVREIISGSNVMPLQPKAA